MEDLKSWIKSNPEYPKIKNTFLMQLAWADCLEKGDIIDLINKYEYETQMQLIMCKEKIERKDILIERTEGEKYIWNMIWVNRVMAYQNGLNWISRLKNGLANK
jgi:hypothetical protein